MTTPPEITAANLHQAVQAALQTWRTPENRPREPWEDLQLIRTERQAAATLHQAINAVLQKGLDKLAQQNARGHTLLTQQYLAGTKRQAIANQLHLSLDQVKHEQKKAIAGLAEIIKQLEQAARQQKIEDDSAQIEPRTYDVLFGVADVCQKLEEALLAIGPPWVMAVVGIGGIGKTSVTHYAAQRVIQRMRYEQVIWLRVDPLGEKSATRQQFTLAELVRKLGQRLCPSLPEDAPPKVRQQEVRQALKTLPYMVVIDNLETDLDAAFLAHLHDLADPSKFLLTTRTLPPVQAGVWREILAELDLDQAAALIRYEASRLGQSDHLANIDDQQVRRIYEKVGGNPLALKLVVGLSHDFQTFDPIIADLTAAHLPDVAAMYRHIYWKAWHALSEKSQSLLVSMPLAADIGMLEEQMKGIGGLDDANLLAAIHELIRRSLLEVRGTPAGRRYGIHSLTRSFLLTDIINWPQ